MYNIRDKCDLSIQTYLKHDIISTITFDKKETSYFCKIRGCVSKRRGIHSTIRRKHFRYYTYTKRKRKTARKGSSIAQGKSIDKQLDAYVSKKKRPRHRMAKKLLAYWKRMNHTIEATQVPVYIKELDCITQADVITTDESGKLWMFEVKSGFPPGGSLKKGLLTNLIQNVPNTIYNHWELQRHYTASGLKTHGLPIHESRVIQVYDEYNKKTKQTKVVVKVRSIPNWVKKEFY